MPSLTIVNLAFLVERDYIMAEAVRRETAAGAQHVVAVVGAAHVPGMVRNLKQGIGAAALEKETV